MENNTIAKADSPQQITQQEKFPEFPKELINFPVEILEKIFGYVIDGGQDIEMLQNLRLVNRHFKHILTPLWATLTAKSFILPKKLLPPRNAHRQSYLRPVDGKTVSGRHFAWEYHAMRHGQLYFFQHFVDNKFFPVRSFIDASPPNQDNIESRLILANKKIYMGIFPNSASEKNHTKLVPSLQDQEFDDLFQQQEKHWSGLVAIVRKGRELFTLKTKLDNEEWVDVQINHIYTLPSSVRKTLVDDNTTLLVLNNDEIYQLHPSPSSAEQAIRDEGAMRISSFPEVPLTKSAYKTQLFAKGIGKIYLIQDCLCIIDLDGVLYIEITGSPSVHTIENCPDDTVLIPMKMGEDHNERWPVLIYSQKKNMLHAIEDIDVALPHPSLHRNIGLQGEYAFGAGINNFNIKDYALFHNGSHIFLSNKANRQDIIHLEDLSWESIDEKFVVRFRIDRSTKYSQTVLNNILSAKKGVRLQQIISSGSHKALLKELQSDIDKTTSAINLVKL